jgi:hypothetical protein
MNWALILFTLHYPIPSNPAIYEYQRHTIAEFQSLEKCNALAAEYNSNMEFVTSNEPYYACDTTHVPD